MKKSDYFWITSSWALLIAQPVKNPPAMHETPRKVCWRRARLPTPVSWASLVAQLVKNSPTMQETWAQSLGWEDALEKERLLHLVIFSLSILISMDI